MDDLASVGMVGTGPINWPYPYRDAEGLCVLNRSWQPMDLSGKVALVTGAARRVGRAIALELARAGCDIAVHYHRSEGDARSVAEEIRGLGRRVTLVSGD